MTALGGEPQILLLSPVISAAAGEDTTAATYTRGLEQPGPQATAVV